MNVVEVVPLSLHHDTFVDVDHQRYQPSRGSGQCGQLASPLMDQKHPLPPENLLVGGILSRQAETLGQQIEIEIGNNFPQAGPA